MDNYGHGYTEAGEYNPKNDKMKKENIYIDLSKCSEEQQEHIFSLLPPTKTNSLEIFEESVYLHYIEYWGKWIVDDILCIYNKTELPYPEFIKLFEGGEGEIFDKPNRNTGSFLKPDQKEHADEVFKFLTNKTSKDCECDKLQADKAELLEALENVKKMLYVPQTPSSQHTVIYDEIESLIQKHKQ